MATVEQCEQAFHTLADRLASADEATRKRSALDRSLSCTLGDINAIFAGRLHDGQLEDIRQVDSPEAQIKLRMTSDDLVNLVAGELNFGKAWANGRIKVSAHPLDLIKLRSVF
jgi:alkyl sulfatase BDS1-like metallo-beta-lactamase superfamily hydrolase